jgi:hypothetical protein
LPAFNNSEISVCKSDVCRGPASKDELKTVMAFPRVKTQNLSDALEDGLTELKNQLAQFGVTIPAPLQESPT